MFCPITFNEFVFSNRDNLKVSTAVKLPAAVCAATDTNRVNSRLRSLMAASALVPSRTGRPWSPSRVQWRRRRRGARRFQRRCRSWRQHGRRAGCAAFQALSPRVLFHWPSSKWLPEGSPKWSQNRWKRNCFFKFCIFTCLTLPFTSPGGLGGTP